MASSTTLRAFWAKSVLDRLGMIHNATLGRPFTEDQNSKQPTTLRALAFTKFVSASRIEGLAIAVKLATRSVVADRN